MPLPAGHPLETYYNQYSNQLNWARYYITPIESDMDSLLSFISFTDTVWGPYYWQDFDDNLVQYLMWAIASNWLPDQFPQLEFMYREYDYWGGVPKMGDIITAMLTATYEELQSFVGIVDAYRSAVWDQPFNAEFYAALARGFRP